MTETVIELTDAELDMLCEDAMGWPEIPVMVAELRALREQNAALIAALEQITAEDGAYMACSDGPYCWGGSGRDHQPDCAVGIAITALARAKGPV